MNNIPTIKEAEISDDLMEIIDSLPWYLIMDKEFMKELMDILNYEHN